MAQFKVIFVALKIQNQLRFQCDFSEIYRRGLRCNSRNTVTLSSSFTFEQAHSFSLQNRRALTFCTGKLHQNRDGIAAGLHARF